MTAKLLDPGMNLTLRPMRYPVFYDMYRDSIKNTWTVEEVDFSTDVMDLHSKITPAERHMIERLVAFFATGDSIVSNNLVLNLYEHINAPEARMYLSRQLYEEALHVQFYLTLLDTYITDHDARTAAFDAIETIPSIKRKADFCFKYIDGIQTIGPLDTIEKRRQFLLNLVCFAACIEGLFFFAAFAYVFFLRSKGLLNGLAAGTNWVFRDETCVAVGSEVLTPHGWVDFRYLTNEDKVLQFDCETEEVSFVKPSRIIRKAYTGRMRVFSNKKSGIAQCLTPDHDVVQKWDYQDTWSKKKVSDFKPNKKKMIPVSGYTTTVGDPLTVWQQFLIAVQADGHIPSRYNGSICGTVPVKFSFAKKRKIDRLRALLDSLGFTYTETQRTADEKHPNRATKTDILVNVPTQYVVTKNFVDWVRLESVSKDWCTSFLAELQHWDGHTPKTKNNGYYIQYTTTHSGNADIVQAIASLCGKQANHSIRQDNRKETYKDVHNIFIHDTNRVTCGSIEDEYIDYAEDVYCVTVPTGAFVMRYKNKVSVTGNCHMAFAMKVYHTVTSEEPELVDSSFKADVCMMINEAIECECAFADDILGGGIPGLSARDMRQYLQYVADRRFEMLGMPTVYGVTNPFSFMMLQDVQEVANFFERRVSAYQVGVTGNVEFDADF